MKYHFLYIDGKHIRKNLLVTSGTPEFLDGLSAH